MAPITTARGLTIGAVSRRTDCNVETIRYYERIGLLPRPPRSAGGQRAYDAPHVRRLRFIRRGRELGFTLAQVRQLLALVDRDATCAEVRVITLAHLGEVRGKIADLRRLERVLADTARRCRGGRVPDCPVIEALSAELDSSSGAALG